MEKLFKNLIGLGFLIVVIGGIIYVAGQMLALLFGQPQLMIMLESTITKVIFPTAAVSGLFCFLYYYLFRKTAKEDD